MVSFPPVSPPEPCAHLCPLPYAPHAILYVQCVYILQVHMATSDTVIHYIGWGCQFPTPRRYTVVNGNYVFDLQGVFQDHNRGIKWDLPVQHFSTDVVLSTPNPNIYHTHLYKITFLTTLCQLKTCCVTYKCTRCPTRYWTRHEDIATKFEQEYVRCVRNEEECVCSAPNCCDTEQRSASNILISGKIIKEMPG